MIPPLVGETTLTEPRNNMSADNEIAVDGWRVSEIRGCPDMSKRHLVVSQIDMTQTPMSYQDASNLAEKNV